MKFETTAEIEKVTRCLVLTSFLLGMLALSTYAQEGFLSIDCGNDKVYTDSAGVKWVPDDDFIQTGTKLEIQKVDLSEYSLRYFAEGRSKDCYVLPVKNRTTYLLRIHFNPGDPSKGPAFLELPVTFDFTLNNNLWATYSVQNDSDRSSVFSEAIFHTFDSNETFVCLLKGPEGFPFVNTLELRELPLTAYGHELKELKKFLTYAGRYNTGVRPNVSLDNPVWYPDDPYDRYWFPVPPSVPSLNPRVPFERVERLGEDPLPPDFNFFASDGYNWPPRKVLDDAWVGRDLSLGPFRVDPLVERFYIAFYLQEVRPVGNGTDLEENPVGMIFEVNDNIVEVNLTNINDLQQTFRTDVKGLVQLNLTLKSQPWSNRSAVLNAFEILYSDPLDTSAISSKDSSAMKSLQNSFSLQDWTGDPCYPVAWDWVTCDPKNSRVVKLTLSDMKISGSIPEDISKLTELTEILLDNNNISGSIPQSMRFLPKLQVLALDNNNLSGELPVAFLNRPGFTFGGNPELCPVGLNCASTDSSQPPPQVPSAAVKAPSVDIRIKMLIGMIVAVGIAILAL